MTTLNFHSWWGRQTIEPQRTDLWQMGPLNLWVQHLAHRWTLSWTHSGDWLEPRVRIVPGVAAGELPPPNATQVNFVLGSSPRSDLLFVPSLADRPLINRLASPLHILPGETASLYVLSPLRLRIEVAENSKVLQEIPTHRLSDTWFGPISSPSSALATGPTPLSQKAPTGELCYASSLPAFLELREVPIRLHCAISAISIRNAGKETLRVERINVPLPRLSLFYSPRTGFWTDAFSLVCEGSDELASLKLERQPPAEASPSQFVAGPRQAQPDSMAVIRAVGSLFRERHL